MTWTQPAAKRDWWFAVKRGLGGRCPACGEGRLFGRFLKVEPACAVCGTQFQHQRADDLPAYLVILAVGHVVVGGMLSAESGFEWPTWLHMVVWPTVSLVLSLALIQPIKGAVVAYQWALHMHGFGDDDDEAAVLRADALKEAKR